MSSLEGPDRVTKFPETPIRPHSNLPPFHGRRSSWLRPWEPHQMPSSLIPGDYDAVNIGISNILLGMERPQNVTVGRRFFAAGMDALQVMDFYGSFGPCSQTMMKELSRTSYRHGQYTPSLPLRHNTWSITAKWYLRVLRTRELAGRKKLQPWAMENQNT